MENKETIKRLKRFLSPLRDMESTLNNRAIIEAIAALEQQQLLKNLPEIVCLCGSTRFYKTFDEQNFKLTLAGKIVLSIGCNTKSNEGLGLTAEDKINLDELHKRKIDLCDKVLVLNVNGYTGDSTRSEIEYANNIGKPVEYLLPEPPKEG